MQTPGTQGPFNDDPFGSSPFGNWPAGPPVFGSSSVPPSYPPPPGPNDKANTFATLSVVLAFLCAPVGAVLGHIGLSQIRRTGQQGRQRAITGLVLSYTVIVVTTIALVTWGVVQGFGWHSTVAAVPLKSTPLPPLGADRPPRSVETASFERAPTGPRWSYTVPGKHGTADYENGDAWIRGGDAKVLIVVSTHGVMALNAQTGVPAWPAPVRPNGPEVDMSHVHCAPDRSSVTIGCVEHFGNDVRVFFIDVGSGTQLGTTEVAPQAYSSLTAFGRSGDGFMLYTSYQGQFARQYRADGSLAWHREEPSDEYCGIRNFADQGVVSMFCSKRPASVLDAATGNELVHSLSEYPRVRTFSSGFVVQEAGPDFTFYDFTGRAIASIPSDGFELVDRGGGYLDTTESTGTDQPLLYNRSKRELRAVDPSTGRVLWSQHLNEGPSDELPSATGSGETCFIATSQLTKGDKSYQDIAHLRIRVQGCRAESSNPFIPANEGYVGGGSDETKDLVDIMDGFDGRRIVNTRTPSVFSCIDISSGDQVWTAPYAGDVRWLANGTYTREFLGNSKGVRIERWF